MDEDGEIEIEIVRAAKGYVRVRLWLIKDGISVSLNKENFIDAKAGQVITIKNLRFAATLPEKKK